MHLRGTIARRETDRQTQTDRHRQTDTERQTDRQTETDRDREAHRERDRDEGRKSVFNVQSTMAVISGANERQTERLINIQISAFVKSHDGLDEVIPICF